MFVILSTYLKNLEEVDGLLKAHRDYLEIGYAKDYFFASGPQEPRTGGVILSQLDCQKTLEDFLAHDPFYLNGLASYEIRRFTPVKYHHVLETLVHSKG